VSVILTGASAEWAYRLQSFD